MNALYLDSSAFVKLVVEEAETTALRAHLVNAGARHVSSMLLRAETLRAVRAHGDDALLVAREALRRIDLVAIDDRILDAAGMLESRILRTLDAIHIATTLAIGDDLDAVVTYDQRMIETAKLLGVPSVSPR